MKQIRELLLSCRDGELSASAAAAELEKLKAARLRSPLSEGQLGLWWLQKTSLLSSSYHVPLCLRLTQEVDETVLERAFSAVLDRHPALTSVMREEKGIPYQILRPGLRATIVRDDVSTLPDDAVLTHLREVARQPFSLEEGPLFRLHLMERRAGDRLLLIVIHHIVIDGTSLHVMLDTFLAAYQALSQGTPPHIGRASASYADFVAWEKMFLTGEQGQKHLAYWEKQLALPLPALELPTDHPRRESGSRQGRTYSRSLAADQHDLVRAFAKRQSITPSVVFLGVYQLLLSRYSNQQNVIVGMPTKGRPEERFEGLVGYFVNMIPVRSQLDGQTVFADLLQTLQFTLIDGMDHAAYPFPALVRELRVPRIAGQPPVFQVAFEFQNAGVMSRLSTRGDNAAIEAVPGLLHQEGEYELVLEVYEQPAGYVLNFKYDPELFALSSIERMSAHYLALLSAVLENPQLALGSYSLLTGAERRTILADWNGTRADYPELQCVHQLFEQQAARTPDAIALRFKDSALSYRDLNAKSESVARRLQAQGVGPNQLVGICVERSLDLVVGLLGILKAGGAYVPLDPGYPASRLQYMLEDSRAPLILTQRALLGGLLPLLPTGTKAVVIDEAGAQTSGLASPAAQRDQAVTTADLAYVIYTSGSTGNPKGVMIGHKGLTNFLTSMARCPGLTAQDRLLAVTTLSFDIAALEIFLPLIRGAQCVIASAETARDAEKLKTELKRNAATIMQATPVTWTMLFQSGWRNDEKLRILCGGEALPEALKQKIIATGSEAWNLFGPTETTIWSTVGRITAAPTSIGTPIANTQVYVLDSRLQPVPAMVPGDLHIGGDGLAKGYLNRPEMTAERFIDNPFVPNTRLYKTGDLARWRDDGQLEYLGRIDTQVKVRGYRIEIQEVEAKLAEHAGVRDCAVVLHDDGTHKQLVAHVIGDEALFGELRTFLKGRLPEYMVPARFVKIDAFPMTPNGKLDRKALAQRRLPVTKTRVGAVRNPSSETCRAEIEHRVAAIWRESLQIDDFGLDDGFFDVGGDSLRALTVAQRISQSFGCEFGVTAMFRHATVRAIVEHLADVAATNERTIVAGADAAQREAAKVQDGVVSRTSARFSGLAVIGISCQFPDAEDHRSFWENLRNGKESVRFFTEAELRDCGMPADIIRNKSYVPAQSAIQGKAFFDPEFFKIAPKDAALMDPQLRLLLQNAWKAVEDAGYRTKDIPSTSVFMSASTSGYGSRNALMPTDTYLSWVLSQSGTIPTIISNKLDLRGPSYSVHSNCSSSLVGLYAAYQAIRAGESEYALVGASTLFPGRGVGYLFQEGMNFSSDGHIKPFDAAADGMISGEGVAVLLVKAAAQAIADGDHIYALIRGVGLNNDGADKAGFYAPSVRSQADVIEKVLRSTDVHPRTIGYVEAHGTGTKLGDPVEFAALREVYARYTDDKQFCGLGSVKSNIGHLDTAAGLAGCIKLALCLEHSEMVPTLNYTAPNPNIDLQESPFYVVSQRVDWGSDGEPRRAALSSFGIGGTNTHAILEEAPRVVRQPAVEAGSYVVPLSARDSERLGAYAESLLRFLSRKDASNVDLRSLAYTLQVGREEMARRVAFVTSSASHLIEQLQAFTAGEDVAGCVHDAIAQRAKIQDAQDSQLIVETWRQDEGGIDKLATAWVQGAPVDWRSLYSDDPPRRMSLPTYPFARERYWSSPSDEAPMQALAAGAASTPRQSSLSADGHVPDRDIETGPQLLVFEENWQAAPLNSASDAGQQDETARTLVCFLTEPRHRQAFAQAVSELSPRTQVVFVSRAKGGAAASTAGAHEVSSADSWALSRVLHDIQANRSNVEGLLYLWPLEHDDLIADQTAWVRIVQAVASSGLACRRLILAGCASSETNQAHLESWIGAERSIGLALPGTAMTVALEAADAHAGADMTMWARRLLGELRAAPQSVLYRQDMRHTCVVRECAAPTVGAGAKSTGLRRGATYLLTGGCGGLGMAFASHLARSYSPNLVIAGRSAPNEAVRHKVRHLEELGAQVLYVQADVSDGAAMKVAISRALERFGQIHGVIHAAGIAPENVSLLQKTAETFERNLAAKIKGALVLDRLLQDQALDFVCYFSSISAVLGDFGGCDYAVGNRFLMAYALARHQRVLRGEARGKTLAIAWPLWQAGGMTFATASQTELYLQSSGQSALPTARGIELFERLLSGPVAVPLLLVGDPSRLRRMLGPARTVSGASSSPPAGPEARDSERRVETRDPGLAQRLEWDLKEQVCRFLEMPRERVDVDVNLAELGFDSIGLSEFARRLSTYYSIEFSPALFFSYSNVAHLTKYMLEAFGPMLDKFYRDDVPAVQVTDGQHARRTPPATTDTIAVQSSTAASAGHEPIAIIGMSGRFPDARNIEELWQILEAGREAVREIPLERFDWRELYHAEAAGQSPTSAPAGKISSKWLGALPGVGEFDPLFFDISPREAELMDPRQRLLLQESFKALEDAGYGVPHERNSKTGMFVGVEQGDYQLLFPTGSAERNLTGNHDAILAARLSYFLNLRGPVMAINTACSSGLVAAHQACVSLRAGECDIAIAASANLILTPYGYVGMTQAGMLSPNGKCRAFDRRANGMVPGEAVVAVVLKRLSQAEADRDVIYGVIRGSGINYDGKTNGMTAPNGAAQAELIADVHRRAEVNPREIEYVVTHGTGTRLGDPVEIQALTDAFNGPAPPEPFCAITSTKTNLGHTFAASGLVSLVVLIESLRRETIPASLHCEQLSDYTNWKQSPFYVNVQNRPWPARTDKPRIGAVSAFGISGTNAHMVVESYDQTPAASNDSPAYCLLALSAKTGKALQQRARDLIDVLRDDRRDWNAAALTGLCATLLAYRQHFAYRCAAVVADCEQAIAALERIASDEKHPVLIHGKRPRDFVEQPILLEYAIGLIGKLAALPGDATRYQQSLAALGDLYCQGYALDWRLLHIDHPPQRMSLPTYPFERDTYWAISSKQPLDEGRPAELPVSTEVREEAVERAERVLTKEWKLSPAGVQELALKNVIIVCGQDTQRLAERLSADLKTRSKVLVLDGELHALSVEADLKSCDGWIDLVGCGSHAVRDLEWIALLQRWVNEGPKGEILALCVTRGLEAHANSSINLSGADRVGLYRMLSSEYSRVRSRHLDVDPRADDTELAAQIIDECGECTDEIEVCYRQGERYCAVLQETSLEPLVGRPDLAFPPGHVLLITGGTRGLGYLCAWHFVRHYGVKRLALIGREALPPRAEWHRVELEDAPIAEKVRSVLALESEGAEVRVFSVSVADGAALRQSIESIRETMGPIGGILHCAGTVDSKELAFIGKTPGSMHEVLAPKVAGLDHLVQCVANEPLQFFVLFSSVSAVAPALAVGQSDYAMANAYMDYVAQAHANTLPIISVQWPSWKEAGMGESRSSIYRQLGFHSHSNVEGLRLLDRLLARKYGAVVLPAMVDPLRWRPAELLRSRRKNAVASGEGETRGEISTPASDGETLAAVQSWIVKLAAAELKIEASKIELDRPLPDYGADSILLTRLLRPVGERVGESVDPSILFEYPTILAFSKWLVKRYAEALSAGFERLAPAPSREEDVSPAAPATGSLAGTPRPAGAADIAVVGLSCRFASAGNADEYWRLLAAGQSAIRAVPKERWGSESRYYAGVINDATQFDPAFFNISLADARAMDPQALLLLEETLKLLHRTGYTPEEVRGRSIGVYLGARSQHIPDADSLAGADNPIMVAGANYLATNISRFFDLRGPSVVVDTACSSALVAMNMAIQSLRSGEIESSLVAGVNLLASDSALQMFERRGILGRGPAMHLFDGRASGVVLGEGAGVVWLKTVERAIHDGDTIHAVIKAVAINNDGRTAGPAAPNMEAQKAVMRSALAMSGKQAHEIAYIEANGSGTEVTDLIELKAIEAVYRPSSASPCELGSVKPNIGHPLAAEGIASFIKCVLMLHHGKLVPFLSAQEPMRHYDFKASPFRFPRELRAAGDVPAALAINCFADGGTNAHVILESWRETEPRGDLRRPIEMPPLSKVECRAEGRRMPSVAAAISSPARLLATAASEIKAPTNGVWKRLNGGTAPGSLASR